MSCPVLFDYFERGYEFGGPRPLLVEYLPLYSKEQARSHNVRPDITGRAQMNGRYAVSWQQKFDLHVWYVANMSIRLDVKILLLTVKKVILKNDISSDSEVTMSAFTGSKND